VTHGQGQGISRIGRLWNFCESATLCNHGLHLGLIGISKTGDCQLHFLRGVLNHWDTANARKCDSDTTRLRNWNGGSRVALKEHFFDHNGVGLKVGKELYKVSMEIG